MKKHFLVTALLVVMALFTQSLAAGADGKSADVKTSGDQASKDQTSKDQNSWQRDLLTWRAERATSLQAPEGWLSLIALGWLKEGDNSFGSAEEIGRASCRERV
jgi:hypothetical protein